MESDKKTISRLKPNAYYCGLIQNLYAGTEGELCTTMQFFYSANILSPFNKNLSSILEQISKTDFLHASMLSDLIIRLGGDPILINNQGKWLSGRSLDYIKDTKQIISLNLELKEKIIIDTRTAIAKIDDIQVKQVLFQILSDEILHRKSLQNLKRVYCEQPQN
ncbi:MAG: hypothetical protein RR140_00180 [Clostridia bacterium]